MNNTKPWHIPASGQRWQHQDLWFGFVPFQSIWSSQSKSCPSEVEAVFLLIETKYFSQRCYQQPTMPHHRLLLQPLQSPNLRLDGGHRRTDTAAPTPTSRKRGNTKEDDQGWKQDVIMCIEQAKRSIKTFEPGHKNTLSKFFFFLNSIYGFSKLLRNSWRFFNLYLNRSMRNRKSRATQRVSNNRSGFVPYKNDQRSFTVYVHVT